jgi:hypothetical protein
MPVYATSENGIDWDGDLTSPDGAWHLGIGDPTPIGWLTVAAYFLAGWGCWTVFSTAGQNSAARRSARVWLLIAMALLALGINKQLDLQTALTAFGRSLARSGGWYERRHEFQIFFIAAIGVAGIVALALMAWLLWPPSWGRGTALAGLLFLCCFVLIRASSFHHVDIFLGQTVLGLRWNWILELSGIGLVGAGALIERRDRRTPA